ncbi:hypothetical protein FRC00_012030, partial [Tulasnella sp. 408]
ATSRRTTIPMAPTPSLAPRSPLLLLKTMVDPATSSSSTRSVTLLIPTAARTAIGTRMFRSRLTT